MSIKFDSAKKIRKDKTKRKYSSWEEFEEIEREIAEKLTRHQEPTIKGQVRIVGGKVKNFTIDIPKKTRPVTDRMKTTLFDILREDIKNRTVLDLYAGSGSFGLEALSRGAQEATFVDAAKHAEKVLNGNVIRTGFLTEANVVRARADDFLKQTKEEGTEFELIFIDPPYKFFNTKQLSKIRDIINAAKELLPGYKDFETKKFKGAIVVKHPRSYPIDKVTVPGMRLLESYGFGRNAMTFYIVEKPGQTD